MEYANLWHPILLIAVTLFIGLVLGALYMYHKMKSENDLLEIDLDMMKEKIENKN